MASKAAITVLKPREEVERLWRSMPHPQLTGRELSVSFAEAPGERGTEIYIRLPEGANLLTGAIQKLRGEDPYAKARDELHRFKQQVETGVITRSEAVPEGELLERKFKQRPAQPLREDELEKAGVR